MCSKNNSITPATIGQTHLLFIVFLLAALLTQCKVAAPRSLNPGPENISFAEYLDIKSQIDFNNACSEPSLTKMSRLVEYHEKIVYCICDGNKSVPQNAHKINLFVRKETVEKIDKKCLDNLRNRFILVPYELNKQLIKTVDSLVDWDQKYRSIASTFSNRDSIRYYMLLQDKIDSTNMITLKDMVNKIGWPGRFQLGTGGKDLTALVIHSPEEDNSYFLNILIQEARKQNVHWLSAAGIMRNMLFRFPKGKYNELAEIYLKKGNIDMIKSLLAIYSLASLINNNPYIYHIFINNNLHSDNTEALLNDLKAGLESVHTDMTKVRFHFEPIDHPSRWPFLIQTTKN